jgi:AraC-like DNA-binding protein
MRNKTSVLKGNRFPSAAGTMSRLAFARAKAAGVAVDRLLQRAGLSRQQINDPLAMVKAQDQINFLNFVADAVEDEFLGFRLAQSPDLREIGLLYYVLASSQTFIDALQRGARYSSIVNEGISLRCIDGKSFGLSFHYVGVERHLDRHQIEFWITAIVRVFRQLTGLRLLPDKVRLCHRRSETAELSEFFGNNIEFGAEVDELTFSGSVRQSPLVSADPFLNKLLSSYCEEAIANRPKDLGLFRTRVENAIVPLLPHGGARVSEVARQLGLSQRTFARRLALENVTFSELLQELRSDLARRYLDDGDLAISQIAWLLGYREVGAFSHAFKRWTGETPGEARSRD